MGLQRKFAPLGDINGDGITDLGFVLPDVGEFASWEPAEWIGTLAVHVVLGDPNIATDWSLDTIRQNTILKITSNYQWTSTNEFFYGMQLFPSGDVNGDGLDDFVLLMDEYINSDTDPVVHLILWS